MSDKQARTDMEFLMSRAEFRRFMWRAIQMAGIFDRVTDGSEGRHLAYHEGRRNLGLELLADAAQGQAVEHPDYPMLTAIQILREEAQQPNQEARNGRRNDRDRYDRNRDLNDRGDGDGSDDDR